MRLDVNIYRREVNNYADDDQLLNTGVSYPIAFDRAVIYGAEGKLEVVRLGQLSGYVSYSYMVGNVWFPVTGGLFLGGDADNALTETTGHFPDSQDQRNTIRTRFQYQPARRFWLAAGASDGSGCPSYTKALRQTLWPSTARPLSAESTSIADVSSLSLPSPHPWAWICTRARDYTRLQLDGDNLNNRLNVIDFGGLFSGNAIAPGRSWALRLTTSF